MVLPLYYRINSAKYQIFARIAGLALQQLERIFCVGYAVGYRNFMELKKGLEISSKPFILLW